MRALHRALKFLAAFALCAAAAADAQPVTCNRNCLDGIAGRFLKSLVAHDPAKLKFTPNARFTQDGQELKPGEGFWRTASGIRQHRLNILDEAGSTAAGLAVMEEGDQIALLAYRIKVQGRRISELETLVVQRGGERELIDPVMLAKPREEFLLRVPEPKRASREELLRISQLYPDGLKAGSFVEVNAQFAEDARRLENGTVLAGPDCTRFRNCKNMLTQSSPVRPSLRQRLLAVDEKQGITFYWLAWEQATGNTLVVWEAFKVYDGKIQAVEAFLERGDPKVDSGWEGTAGRGDFPH